MKTAKSEKVEKCPKCGGAIWGVEYAYNSPERYDGVSEWSCIGSLFGGLKNPHTGEHVKECDYRMGRFCGKPLEKGQIEPRYCDGSPHPPIK